MARKVMAVRNDGALVMNIIFACVGAAAFGVTLWITCRAEETSDMAIGAVVTALGFGVALFYGIPAVFMLLAGKEVIVMEGETLILSKKRVNVCDVLDASLSVRRSNGGSYSYGNITVNLKSGKKIVCRGIADAKNAYDGFCKELASRVTEDNGR